MKRNGFTLVEVLVILAIIAALAAILVPTVANQVRKADVGRVTGDLTNLRSGVEAFLVNVHRYPRTVRQLSVPITTGDTDINAVTYPAGLVGRWEGPYIDRVLTAAGDSMPTGFGGFVQDTFRIVAFGTGVDYLTVVVTGIGEPEFDRLDEDVDDGDGASAGRLRFAAPDTVRFLALPIN